MNALLWVLQVALAAAFATHGGFMLTPPPEVVEALNAIMSTPFRIFLGVAEVLAALGLTLPGLTRIMPRLIPLAAVCLLPIMVGATVLHLQRGEHSSAVTTTILFALLAFVAYARWSVQADSAAGFHRTNVLASFDRSRAARRYRRAGALHIVRIVRRCRCAREQRRKLSHRLGDGT